MESDALNFFLPFRRLEPKHENQLTRALLVVLRYSPIAHAAWLRLVAPARHLHQLPVAEFRTQRRAVRLASDDDEQADLVSVFLTPEAPLVEGDTVITESDRTQVLDAVIDYGGELLVVIENKVAEDDDRQARELNIEDARIRLADDQKPVVVLWRDVLEAFIALRERGLVAGAEATLLDDFLLYTEDYFADLGPFRTLRLAHGNRFRQTRRLRQLLGEAVDLDATIDQYGPYVITPACRAVGEKSYLRMADEDTVELAMFPADTLSQARAFFTNPVAVAGVDQLRQQPGWQAGPNFHFGHIQRGYCWTTSERPLDEYLTLWTNEIHAAGNVPRRAWDAYWAWLEKEQIAAPRDRAEFDRHFTQSQRKTASPRPGLWLARNWLLAEAEVLDGDGAFHRQVRDALNAALVAFGERPLGA